MVNTKIEIVTELFRQWSIDVARAEALLASNEYFLEAVLVLSCHIGALARLRYPHETKDWKSYKTVVWEYSGQKDIYENIDLLFFYQWPKSKLANNKIYTGIRDYPKIVGVLAAAFGDEDAIRGAPQRYQKREDLIDLIKEKNIGWFDEANFVKYIELFSNNQILYEFLRCEAVHNADFPLFNCSYHVATNTQTYKDNHQVNGAVILATVKGIVENLKAECLGNTKWPWEL